MNKHRFLLITVILSVLCIKAVDESNTLTSRPILFIDTRKIFDGKSWIEFLEPNDRLNKAANNESRCSANTQSNKETSELFQASENLKIKMMIVANRIAKNKGACALLNADACGNNIYIDPNYDITSEVIEELNKSYVPSVKPQDQIINPQEMLYQAIKEGSTEGIKNAIRVGANVNLAKAGQLPIFWALTFKQSNAVKCLLEHDAKVTRSLIQFAIDQYTMTYAAALMAIKCGVNLNDTYPYRNGYCRATILQMAASTFDFETVLLLIKNGATFSAYTLIETTSGPEKINLIEVVTHWCHAKKDIALELIQLLINHDYKINDIWAAKLGQGIYDNEIILNLFIKNGANPNNIFEYPRNSKATWTPLLKAIYHGNKEVVKILLDAGANLNQQANPYPNIPTNKQQTPLSLAINQGKNHIVELLLEHGAVI